MSASEAPPASDAAVDSRALAALLLGAVGIAFAPILVRWSEVSATPTAFLRMLTALPLWLAALAWTRCGAAPRPQGAGLPWAGLLLVALCFTGDLAAWHRSIHYTSVANATLLANFAPVFVTAGAWLWMGERITRTFLIGMVLALVGACLLVRSSQDAGGTHVYGDLLGLLTAAFYGGYQLAVKRVRRGLGTVELMTATTALCALMLLALSWCEGAALFPATPRGWLVAVGLGAIPQFAGQGAIAYGLAHLPSSFSSVSLLLQPATATLLAWQIFREVPGPWQGLGGAAILAGILLARRGVARAEVPSGTLANGAGPAQDPLPPKEAP